MEVIFLITKFNEKYSKSGISSFLSSLASENKNAKLKIIHDNNFEPFVYAIGFGNKINSSLIVGGIDMEDNLSSAILLELATILSKAMLKNDDILGIDSKRMFQKKGVWIIPNYKSLSCDKSFNFISEKLSPKRLLELNIGDSQVKYDFGKKTPANSRLFAYLLASSCSYNIDISENYDENSLCSWFVKEFIKPAYKISIGQDFENTNEALTRFLEAFMLFIAS